MGQVGLRGQGWRAELERAGPWVRQVGSLLYLASLRATCPVTRAWIAAL